MSYIIHINVIITLFSYLMFSNEQLHFDSHHIKASISSRVIFLFYISSFKHNNKTFETAKNVLAPEPNMSEHKPFSATKKKHTSHLRLKE